MVLEKNDGDMEQIDLHSLNSDKLDATGAPTARATSSDRVFLVELFVTLFGLGSWFGLTTIFSQMPLIIGDAPEESYLPLHLSLSAHAGNAMSVLYVYVHTKTARKINDAHVMCMLMAVGCVAALCMPFTYRITIGDVSIALHVFTFIFATIGGFCSLVFLPYMKRFRANYVFIFFFGQALNDALTNGLAAIQGLWGSSDCSYHDKEFSAYARHITDPWFTPSTAFLIVSFVLAISTAAFILLHKLEICRNEFIAYDSECPEAIERNGEEVTDASTESQPTPQLRFVHLFMANVMNEVAASSIFPFIHTNTCLQYVRRPISYNVAILLISITDPLICFVAILNQERCMDIVRWCKARIVLLVTYFMTIAITVIWAWPFLSLLGLILLVVSWMVFVCSLLLMKVIISTIFSYPNGKLTVSLQKYKPKVFKSRLF